MTISDKSAVNDVKSISIPTLSRLPLYYNFLKSYTNSGRDNMSCSDIAKNLDLTSIQVRKDLESIGAKGRPKIGYSKDMLIKLIAVTLGYENVSEAFIVGVGNLGKALLSYKMFEEYGLNIIAGFDTNSDLVNTKINDKLIFNISKFQELTKRMRIKIGIITVPAQETQKVADMMIEAGIEAIWNFVPIHIKAPKNIIIQNVNMASSLAVLSNKLKQKEQGEVNG